MPRAPSKIGRAAAGDLCPVGAPRMSSTAELGKWRQHPAFQALGTQKSLTKEPTWPSLPLERRSYGKCRLRPTTREMSDRHRAKAKDVKTLLQMAIYLVAAGFLLLFILSAALQLKYHGLQSPTVTPSTKPFEPPPLSTGDSVVQTCKTDSDGTWYFSVGRNVFKDNYDPSSRNGVPAITDATQKLLIPPEPAAPVGCRGNPQQLRFFGTAKWKLDVRSSYNRVLPGISFVIQMYRCGDPISCRNFVAPNIIDPVQPNCGIMKFKREFRDGTLYCAATRESLQTLKLSILSSDGWRFVIPATQYAGSMGQNLIVTGGSFWGVQVRDLLSPDVGLFYRYGFPASIANINPDYVIAADKAVFQIIQEYQVQNYPWPAQ